MSFTPRYSAYFLMEKYLACLLKISESNGFRTFSIKRTTRWRTFSAAIELLRVLLVYFELADEDGESVVDQGRELVLVVLVDGGSLDWDLEQLQLDHVKVLLHFAAVELHESFQ